MKSGTREVREDVQRGRSEREVVNVEEGAMKFLAQKGKISASFLTLIEPQTLHCIVDFHHFHTNIFQHTFQCCTGCSWSHDGSGRVNWRMRISSSQPQCLVPQA